MIETIEIQPFFWCNRKCSFCPTFLDRKSNVAMYINKDLFLNVIKDNIDCFADKVLMYVCRYCEPYYDMEFVIEIMKDVKTIFSNNRKEVTFGIHTNGDMMSFDDMNYLLSLNLLSKLNVNLYNRDINYGLDLLTSIEGYSNGKIDMSKFKRMELKYKLNNVAFTIECEKNKNIELCNRGGILYKKSRIESNLPECDFSRFMAIDYNGDVVTCCEVHSSTHPTHVVGNIYNDNFKNIINKIRTFNKNNIYCMYCDTNRPSHRRKGSCDNENRCS